MTYLSVKLDCKLWVAQLEMLSLTRGCGVCVAAEPGFSPVALAVSRLVVADDRTTRDSGHSENDGDEEAWPLAQTRACVRWLRWTFASWGQPFRPCHRVTGMEALLGQLPRRRRRRVRR